MCAFPAHLLPKPKVGGWRLPLWLQNSESWTSQNVHVNPIFTDPEL